MKILYGGSVLTQDEMGRVCDAIAYDDAGIVAVGTKSEVEDQAGDEAERVDLAGRAVAPGFIDAHHHLSLTVIYGGALDCGPPAVSSMADFVSHVAEAARALSDDDAWLVGYHFDERHMVERRFPTLAELDTACPDRPLVVMHYSFHACFANSRTLAELGISASSPTPPAGRIGRDRRGRLTGMLYETAMSGADARAENTLIALDPDGIEERLGEHARGLFATGITRVADAMVSPAIAAEWERLRAAGKLPLPVVMMVVGEHGGLVPPVGRLAGPVTGSGPEELRVGPLKLFADGGDELALGMGLGDLPRTAAHLAGTVRRAGLASLRELGRFKFRLGSDMRLHAGLRFLDGAAAAALARDAVDRGFSLAIHAMGNEAVMDAMELLSSVRREHRDSPPPRIEHAFIMPMDLIHRAADEGIQLVCQPEFLSLGGGLESPVPGTKFLPLRSLADAGVHLAGSSDHPVVSFDPLDAMRTAVTRRWGDYPAMHPEEAVTAEEVLRWYTREAARACGCLDTTGTLEPGKRADLAILSADPRALRPERLGALEVVETVLGGETVFRATTTA